MAARPFTMYWYDGGQLPPQELFDDVTLKVERGGKELKPDSSGVLIIGDKAKMYAAGDYADNGIEIIGAEELDVEYPVAPVTRTAQTGGKSGSGLRRCEIRRKPQPATSPTTPVR